MNYADDDVLLRLARAKFDYAAMLRPRTRSGLEAGQVAIDQRRDSPPTVYGTSAGAPVLIPYLYVAKALSSLDPPPETAGKPSTPRSWNIFLLILLKNFYFWSGTERFRGDYCV